MTMYALILAGGSGTRLWPYSRSGRHKQFLALGPRTPDGVQRSMLQQTVDRILPIIPPEHIFVVTGMVYAEMVAEHLPNVPDENIIVEPSGKGTAPCIGLGALHILNHDPDAVMAVLSSDHIVQRADRLRDVLTVGEYAAEKGHLVTIGIHPSSPATGYGYIKRGDLLYEEGGYSAYRVAAFVEKPDEQRARDYVRNGDHYWNAGMFVWRADRILAELEAHAPGVAVPLRQIKGAIGTEAEQSALMRAWSEVESIAIDVAVMERTDDAAVIPADLAWSDVGDWAALADILPRDGAGNAIVGNFVGLDTTNSLVYSDGRVVATIGLQDMLIVDTPDVLLICPRSRAQDVKAMVSRLKSNHGQLV